MLHSTRRHIRRGALATLCTVAVLGLSACTELSIGTGAKKTGGPSASRAAGDDTASPAAEEPFADLSGPEVVNRAITATKGASSLSLDLDLASADGPMKARFDTSRAGQCKGGMNMGGSGTVDVIKTNQDVYMRYDETFLREQAAGDSTEETDAVVDMLAGRWVRTDADEPDAQEALEVCDLDKLLAGFEEGDNLARKGEVTEIRGREALTLTETDGAETYTVYVATEGEPYILKIVQEGGEEPGTIEFSQFNDPVRAEPPADEDIVDLDGLTTA
ncbi:hypothetical protein [Streptomyces sp. GC420]|uniref:hypothetical protein n=1 Tax=Streptomyces sp. GC420 TaxID=2697568 RepID=UPI0014151D35|nr:hypothetical protein [Streptomyces sp. GC420]NBM20995.1 hypothetical protein [Streptomyces sp. GC420]